MGNRVAWCYRHKHHWSCWLRYTWHGAFDPAHANVVDDTVSYNGVS